jgi:hypothetical protein
MMQGGGPKPMFAHFDIMGKNNYFEEDTGNFKASIERIEYFKTTEWALDPFLLGQERPGVEQGDVTYRVHKNAIIALDGERFPSQKIRGKVLPGFVNLVTRT